MQEDDYLARFMRAMDVQQPDWWLRFASQQDLEDYARFCSPDWQGEYPSGTRMELKRQTMRVHIATRLVMPVRAHVQGGL